MTVVDINPVVFVDIKGAETVKSGISKRINKAPGLNETETGARLLPFYPNKTLNQQKSYSLIVPSSLTNNSFVVLSEPITFTL